MKPYIHIFFIIVMAMQTHPSLIASTGGKLRTSAGGSAVEMRTLENGLTIIVKEDHSAPVASVQAWCRTGSIHEDEWLGAGLSHILEHMLFKGTETRSTNEIALGVQEVGGYVNAYTSFDRTVYWVDVPSEGVSRVIDILADAMMNSTLPPGEYEKEQEVIRREFAMGFDSPERTAQKLLFEAAFREHPYRHPVIGYMDVYNKLTREDVYAYYKKRYVPNNMFFVVAGDVEADKVFAQLEEFFKDIPRQKLEPVYIPEEPEQLGMRERHETFPTELTRLAMAWGIPGLTDPDMPALDVLAGILGDGRSSRLHQELREERKLVHSIYAYAYTPKDAGLFVVGAVADPDQREPAREAVREQIARIKEEGVTETELEKAKKQILSSQYGSLKTMRGQASDLGSNWLLAGNLDFTNLYLEDLRTVTADDVRRVANRYLVDKSLTVTSLNPPGGDAAADDGKVVAESGNIRLFTLDNGMRLLVREDPRLPLVSSVAVFRGGVLAETEEDNGVTTLLASMLLKGTENRTAAEIASAIENVGGSISSEAGYNSFSVSTEMMKEDWKLGLDILADVLLRPTFPENEIEREKSSQIAAIKAESEKVLRVTGDLLRSELFGSHPYSMPKLGTKSTVESLGRRELVDYRDAHVRARNAVLAVFGDVDAEEVLREAESLFAGLPSGELDFKNPPEPEPLTSDVTAVRNMDKEQSVIMVGYLGPTLHDEDRLALQVIDEASSDLGSRFFVKIREELGLAYFVGSTMVPGLSRGLFGFYVGTDPAKSAKVQGVLLEEIRALAENGLSEEEFERAKMKLVGQQKIQLQSNDAFAHLAALNELYGLGYDAHEKEIERLESLGIEEVRRVAGEYFSEQNHVVAEVRPPDGKVAENH